MINLTKSGNTIVFEFENNGHYLYNGTIEVPVNSLSLVIDDSEMATFRKSASNDIFISGLYSDFGMTKAELEAWYKENMVGSTGGGGTVDQTIISGSSNAVAGGAVYDKFDEVEQVTAAALNDLNDTLSGVNSSINSKLAISDFNAYSGTVETELGNKFDASAITAYSTTVEVGNAIDVATSGKVDTTAFTAYSASVETALSGKQDTLIAGDNITISGNVISAEGGGGKAINAGTNISISTGETADTINCTLPITASTSIRKNDITIGNDIVNGASDYRRLAIGNGNKYEYKSSRTGDSILIGTPSTTSSVYNIVYAGSCIGIGGDGLEVGYNNLSGYGSIAIGYGSKSIINKSLAIGYGTVASGTTQTNINNQLKIDTDNQIYIKDKTNTNEICLQDYLGGGGEVSSAITSGDTNAVAGGAVYDKLDEVEQVTAAGLNAVNDKFGGLKLVKLTQTEYNNLQVKDSNTLYVIV